MLQRILTPKLTHGFCMEALVIIVASTTPDTMATMVLDMDMVCGVARRGRLKLPPLLPLILMLKLTPIFCMEATMVLVIMVVTTGPDMVLDMECGVARRGRLSLPLLLPLILMLKLILTPKLTPIFCMEATMVLVIMVTTGPDMVLDMDMDLCGVARRGRLNLPLLLLLILM